MRARMEGINRGLARFGCLAPRAKDEPEFSKQLGTHTEVNARILNLVREIEWSTVPTKELSPHLRGQLRELRKLLRRDEQSHQKQYPWRYAK
jgi:hypothetical protein